MMMLARLAIALDLNLNWCLDPMTAYRRGEPLRMARG